METSVSVVDVAASFSNIGVVEVDTGAALSLEVAAVFSTGGVTTDDVVVDIVVDALFAEVEAIFAAAEITGSDMLGLLLIAGAGLFGGAKVRNFRGIVALGCPKAEYSAGESLIS